MNVVLTGQQSRMARRDDEAKKRKREDVSISNGLISEKKAHTAAKIKQQMDGAKRMIPQT